MYEIVAINLGLPFSQLYPRTLPDFPVLGDYYRPHAMFSEPGFLASLLVTGIAVLLPCAVRSDAVLFSKRIQLGFLIVITVGLLFSVALSGYVTLVLALIVLTVVPALRKGIIRAWLVFGVCIAVGLLIASFFAPEILDKMAGRFEALFSILSATAEGAIITIPGSIGARWIRLLSGLEALARNPLFGTGWGQFDQWTAAVSLEYTPSDPRIGALQGGYIQVIAQTGLVGTIVFATLWTQLLREAFYSVTTSEGVNQTLMLSCTCVIIFMLVGWIHSFSAIHTVRWGMIGLCYGYISTKE
jgi:O-antigen ligase